MKFVRSVGFGITPFFALFAMNACTPAPELAPLPPAIRTVTIYKPLDKSLTTPCDDPMWTPDDIQTDVDLMGLYRQQKATSDCNAGKLRAIDKLQPHGP